MVDGAAALRRKWKQALRANSKLQYRGDYFEERTHPTGVQTGLYTGRCCAMGMLARVAGVEARVKADCETYGLRQLAKLAGLRDGEAAELIDLNDVWNASFADIAKKLDEWHPERKRRPMKALRTRH